MTRIWSRRQKKWLAQGAIAKHSIVTTGGVNTSRKWAFTTWESLANGTLEKWQLDYLASINFPKTIEENKRQKKAFKEAKTERNIDVTTAELNENGTALLPYQIRKACNGYKRPTCKYVGGCDMGSRKKGGLCTKHYNEMVAASLVPSQHDCEFLPANKDDELALSQPISTDCEFFMDVTVADWTAADCEFFMDVMDENVVFEDNILWSEEWSNVPTGYEWEEF